MYSTSFQDAMIQLGNTWVRASQIETVKKRLGNTTTTEEVFVTLISGRTVTFNGAKGESQKIARMAIGL